MTAYRIAYFGNRGFRPLKVVFCEKFLKFGYVAVSYPYGKRIFPAAVNHFCVLNERIAFVVSLGHEREIHAGNHIFGNRDLFFVRAVVLKRYIRAVNRKLFVRTVTGFSRRGKGRFVRRVYRYVKVSAVTRCAVSINRGNSLRVCGRGGIEALERNGAVRKRHVKCRCVVVGYHKSAAGRIERFSDVINSLRVFRTNSCDKRYFELGSLSFVRNGYRLLARFGFVVTGHGNFIRIERNRFRFSAVIDGEFACGQVEILPLYVSEFGHIVSADGNPVNFASACDKSEKHRHCQNGYERNPNYR